MVTTEGFNQASNPSEKLTVFQ
uniref:Uncharacterized protein n=1 Tax=Rhizophora mucronata TaxID=61149 RepID=A0A2P2QBF4_RHIMU